MSRGWTRHEGLAVALPIDGIDTDQLIPARFLSRSRSEGYGDFLLHDLRFDTQRNEKACFPLNDPAASGASLLVAGRNFGGGSSREAAVYALVDFGIRVVVAPSFGDIFAANAVNNGLLPALVSPKDAEALLEALAGGPARMSADLESGTLHLGQRTIPFTLDPVWREKLLRGWDDIDLTASHAEAIAAFRAHDAEARPWARPGAET
ncbi:MAG: 3-isopropylmalate dehydratase small subunit [Alphaproteobacteria bacterium HGW-Alphaproteobacteria-2]|nr:MAG: 3-isopropylmalate dehydratase small subunit [Alphaproteobacteria bacterium HGW-Alphaproteobacteria-2]